MSYPDENPEGGADLPTSSHEDVVQSIQLTATATEEGPLPSPQAFKGYEDTLPGAANRILEMAENEQNHRHKHEMAALGIARVGIIGGTRRSYFGMALGFLVALIGILCGTYLAANGHDTSGMALFLASLASLVGVSVYGISVQNAERRRNAEDTEEE